MISVEGKRLENVLNRITKPITHAMSVCKRNKFASHMFDLKQGWVVLATDAHLYQPTLSYLSW